MALKLATIADEEAAVAAAEEALAEAIRTCQVEAYDTYRETLEEELVARAQKLADIQALLEAHSEPAAGTEGARCEKALSNGTWRPARGEQTCEEGLCCGAARVW